MTIFTSGCWLNAEIATTSKSCDNCGYRWEVGDPMFFVKYPDKAGWKLSCYACGEFHMKSLGLLEPSGVIKDNLVDKPSRTKDTVIREIEALLQELKKL